MNMGKASIFMTWWTKYIFPFHTLIRPPLEQEGENSFFHGIFLNSMERKK